MNKCFPFMLYGCSHVKNKIWFQRSPSTLAAQRDDKNHTIDISELHKTCMILYSDQINKLL